MKRALILSALLAGCGGADSPDVTATDVERAVTETSGGVAWHCEQDDSNARKWSCQSGDTPQKANVTVNDDGSFTVD